MDGIRHRALIYLAGIALAALGFLLFTVGLGDGGAGRVEAAQAAVGAGKANQPRPHRQGHEAHAPVPDTAILTVRPGAAVQLREAPGGAVVETLSDTTEFGSPTVLTVLKRRGAWAGVPTQLLPNGKLGWVRIEDRALATDSVGQSIVIDLSAMRGRLFRGGELERRWTVGIGGPETPTPTGRFSITDEIEGGLNPVYGCCAIALSATQPNLPAGWTGGNRIAIHGTAEPLGAANSTGCIHSSDADLHALIDGVPLGTPVTIRR